MLSSLKLFRLWLGGYILHFLMIPSIEFIKKNDLAKCFCTQNLFNDVSKNAGIPSSYYEDRSMKSICEENYIIKHNINYE